MLCSPITDAILGSIICIQGEIGFPGLPGPPGLKGSGYPGAPVSVLLHNFSLQLEFVLGIPSKMNNKWITNYLVNN